MPDTFIGIAEQHGLIVPIGRLVIKKVCEQIIAWRGRCLGPVRVAVNVSGIQFQQSFIRTVRKLLADNGVPPAMLELEITESSIMRDPANTINILNDLKALGVSVSIDDFGTGYSSLSCLRKFPIDSLKIDRSFVGEIATNRDNDTIIKTIIVMAHSMNLKVIAEGVETEEQLNFLRKHDCDSVQGYYFSKPLSAYNMESLLADGCRKCT
jgi:EAL domain-containing protein (putative c-di-GMP-specific phosphodiesterase class I)